MVDSLEPSLLPLGWTVGIWVWGAVAIALGLLARRAWHRRALRAAHTRWYRVAHADAAEDRPTGYRDERRVTGRIVASTPLALPWTRRRVAAVTYVRPKDGHRVTHVARDARLEIEGRSVALPTGVVVAAGTVLVRPGVHAPFGEWGEFEAHAILDGDGVQVRPREGGVSVEAVGVMPPRLVRFGFVERLRFAALVLVGLLVVDVAAGRAAHSALAHRLADGDPHAELRQPGTRLLVRIATASLVRRHETVVLLRHRLRDAADPSSVAALVDVTLVVDGCLAGARVLHERLRDDEAATLLTTCEAGTRRDRLALEVSLARGRIAEASARLDAMGIDAFLGGSTQSEPVAWRGALRLHVLAGDAGAFARAARPGSYLARGRGAGLGCIEAVLREPDLSRTEAERNARRTPPTLERLRLGADESAVCRVLLADLTRDPTRLLRTDDSEYAELVRTRDDPRHLPAASCGDGLALRALPAILLRGRLRAPAALRAVLADTDPSPRGPAVWCAVTQAKVIAAAHDALAGDTQGALTRLSAMAREVEGAAAQGADPRWTADARSSIAYARLLIERRAFGDSDEPRDLGDLDDARPSFARKTAREIAAALTMPARFEAEACNDAYPCGGAGGGATLDELGWGVRWRRASMDPAYDPTGTLDASALATRALGDDDRADTLRTRVSSWTRAVTDSRYARLLAALALLLGDATDA